MEELSILEWPGENMNGDGRNLAAQSVNGHCYAAIIEHWAKARIEGPVQVVARYDESAKQLITLGGLFPAILIAAYSSFKQPALFPLEDVLRQPSTLIFGLFLLFFLAFVGCLIMACRRQLMMKLRGPTSTPTEACDVYLLLKKAAEGALTPKEMTGAVKHWSEELDRLIKSKHRWITWACVFLVSSSVCMMSLLFLTAMGVRL